MPILINGDPKTGGKYTIKKYTSKKSFKEDGTWSHEAISLNPLNPEDQAFMVVGELAAILGKKLKSEIKK